MNFNEPGDPISRYFPPEIGEQFLENFILDGSFYRPRDIIWRLIIAQKQFLNSVGFNSDILRETDIEYSSKLWDEIKYELGRVYSNDDIVVIEMALSGGPTVFNLDVMEERFNKLRAHSVTAQKTGVVPIHS